MKNTHQAATAVAATYYDSVPNRRLSAHFSLREFVMSAAAVRQLAQPSRRRHGAPSEGVVRQRA